MKEIKRYKRVVLSVRDTVLDLSRRVFRLDAIMEGVGAVRDQEIK